jgi:hypothetical protein
VTNDEYHESGEFLDLFSHEAWQALREPVQAALSGAAPETGPVVELGAGSGLGTRVIAEMLPAARILAVEPSVIQRAALLVRLDGLRERVTVVAAGAESVALPDRLGAVVAMNMIGHLTPGDRQALWRRVGDRLAPGAPLVVNLQPPTEPTEIPETGFAEVRVGDHTYVGSGAAQPTGPDTIIWQMRYRVLDGSGRVVRETVADYEWYVVSPAVLLAELSAAGFDAEVGPLDVVRAVIAG